MPCVQIQIQLQDAYARLSEKAELSRQCVFLDQGSNDGFAHAAFSRDSGDLEFRGCRRNLRIQAGRRGSDKIYWDSRVGVLRMKFINIRSDTLE